ncbi:MAG: mobilization protein [Chitinophagaceae bacterium]|nr:mobilization protein [Chitinophagaceae bacterium]
MSTRNIQKNKGGRPKKPDPRTRRLNVACTDQEQNIIAAKANAVGLTVSEYLRSSGLNSHIDVRKKKLPNEVLEFTGRINNIASNINQLAKLNNAGQNFTHHERETMRNLAQVLFELTEKIKAYLQ